MKYKLKSGGMITSAELISRNKKALEAGKSYNEGVTGRRTHAILDKAVKDYKETA